MCVPEGTTVNASLRDFVNKKKLRNILALGSRQIVLGSEGLSRYESG